MRSAEISLNHEKPTSALSVAPENGTTAAVETHRPRVARVFDEEIIVRVITASEKMVKISEPQPPNNFISAI